MLRNLQETAIEIPFITVVLMKNCTNLVFELYHLIML